MKGRHRMIVESPTVKYDFILNRNITILRGGSGTGKTTLINMLRDRRVLGENSNIEVQCDKDYFVLEGEDWFSRLAGIKDRIVFIDEGNRFVSSRKFAGAIKETDNYYVIVTREDLSVLPYSVQEIYELVKEEHTAGVTKVYNTLSVVEERDE